jgi:acyl-CoA synthetase (AMP-forming)/AMP-acid ligase II
VAALRERIAGEPEGAWVLLTEDAYAFAVGLLALWHSGRHAISPPNRQKSSLQMLQTRAAGVLSDRPDWFPQGSPLHPVVDPRRGAPSSLSPLSPDALAVEFYTSGTTGAEKPVTKRIRHLEDEVSGLGATWDELVKGATVFATASHQHLYGLLFGVLWPLSAGHTFQAQHFLHVGELVPRMRGVEKCVLASVPTHLKRLARQGEVATLRGRCCAVFSSGGPLSTETAHRIARVLGRPPLEVLGSTETGGIAWRAQEPGRKESLWTPFSAVRVTRDLRSSVMRVSSPFVSVDETGEGFATGDGISLRPNGCFQLEGRLDRVVKVGEKRLDLARMESQLRGHPCVAEVALATIDRDTELRVAAAVVPTERGWERIRLEGRLAFVRALRASLTENWDPVLHPRLWRTVRDLPENTQGKVPLDSLAQLFQEPDWEGPAADRPEVLEEFRGRSSLERLCLVPRDLSCFPGHFPDLPVVPGVLQLDWAMELVAELLDATPRIEAIESLKLLAPLEPGGRFRIRVRVAPEARVDLKIWSEGAEHARGRVRLDTAGRQDT